jgi:hypothetical protein
MEEGVHYVLEIVEIVGNVIKIQIKIIDAPDSFNSFTVSISSLNF